MFGTRCDGCEEVVAGFVLEECEDCDKAYCEDNGCQEDYFRVCDGCSGYLCSECGGCWRGKLYCDECYAFPHDD